MPAVERERVHLAFRDDELDVVVATIAFGMGVDKPNVRYVFHADISESPDAYWQEIGRGGRDGKPASAVLFYRPEDLGLRDYFGARSTLRAEDIAVAAQAIAAAGGTPVHVAHVADRLGMSHDRTQRVVARLADAGSVEVDARGMIRARPGMEPMAAVADAVAAEERRQRVEGSRLRMMRAYADTGECRRAFLLSYFGEPVTRDCGHCDRCRERAEQRAAGRRPRRRASTAGERSFPVGSAVDHAQWGRGTVQRHESGRVTVLFDEVGYKTLDLAAVMERSLLVPAAEEQGAAA